MKLFTCGCCVLSCVLMVGVCLNLCTCGCVQVNATCASQAYVVPGLLEGQEYLFRVRAENRLGFSPYTVTSEPARARDPICK